ncbi:hypothetical protein KAFR_0A01900 [Kazachstania africana CBS 2517]|uniref:Programmed cell death protein 5 n=1 Tax=Kazachstania africana (strain ATCC 22294 / BCRC 22015 / CBS 2517 / CECT 1963 / NBRC 1671 / NRRL Y-8276) TaxID=1071382 RepID=H2AMM8_KAZAF|nr:hypothetical protein KAFR_0A01900 [Kazachstania africana CBS 2517]CCF55628.1 hypothetical protein KAFR_0A01900 [Kazachstania africana CBS 2517]
MDAELQALREARLQQLKNGGGSSSTNGGSGSRTENSRSSAESIGSSLVPFLESNAMERLQRVALVKPDRALAVESYLKQLIGSGQLRHKVSENEIVSILNNISQSDQRNQSNKIIFNRKDHNNLEFDNDNRNIKSNDSDDEDDFFD